METKHTPEDWIVSIAETKNRPVQIRNKDNKKIAWLYPNQELEANAKLIVAAPKLLVALNNAVIFLKCCPHLTEDQKPKGLESWERIINDAID